MRPRRRRRIKLRFSHTGAGCLPDPLFAHGVTALGGTWIVDAAAFKSALAQGRSWSGTARKFLLQAGDYPGLEALLGSGA